MQFRYFFAVVAALSLVAGSVAQPARIWTRTTGLTTPSSGQPVSVRTDAAGNVYVCSQLSYRGSSDGFGVVELTKFTAAGAQLWRVVGPGDSSGVGRVGDMVLDPAGNPIVNYSDIYSAFGFGTESIYKFNTANGSVVWQKAIPAGSLISGACTATDSSGNVVVLHQSSVITDTRMQVTKLAGNNGNILWTRTVARTDPGKSDFGNDVAVDAGNNIAIVGVVRASDPCLATAPSSMVIGKLRGTDGLVTWVQKYVANPTGQTSFARVAVDSSGNVFAGSTMTVGVTNSFVVVKRLGTTGAVVWNRILTSAGLNFYTFMTDLQSDPTNGVAAFGNGGAGGVFGTILVRYTSTGTLAYTKAYDDRSVEFFNGTQRNGKSMVARGTNYFIAGTRDTTSGPTETSIAVVNKILISNGSTVWQRLYNGAANRVNSPLVVNSAPNGDAVLAAGVADRATNIEARQTGTARFLSTNGNFVWTRLSVNASIPTPDQGSDIVIDGGGFVYVVGTSNGRIWTAKYNSAGTLLWAHVYDDTGVIEESTQFDNGPYIRVDGSGNVLVMGENRGAHVVLKRSGSTGGLIWAKRFDTVGFGSNFVINGTGDLYVPVSFPSGMMKLASATGNTLWSVTKSGTLAGNQGFYAGLGPNGNPILVGNTFGTSACEDDSVHRVTVWKLNPSTGAQLWAREVGGPALGINEPAGVGVDSANNVLVAANSQSAASNDVMTFKLNGTTGAVLWNTRHDDAAKDQVPTAMILDGANNLLVTGYGGDLTGVSTYTIKVLNSTGAKVWTNKLTAPVGHKVAMDIARDTSNNVYVSGFILDNNVTQLFGQKIAGANGASLYVAPCASGVGDFQAPSVAVSLTNRMHLIGTVRAAGSLANISVVQFGP